MFWLREYYIFPMKLALECQRHLVEAFEQQCMGTLPARKRICADSFEHAMDIAIGAEAEAVDICEEARAELNPEREAYAYALLTTPDLEVLSTPPDLRDFEIPAHPHQAHRNHRHALGRGIASGLHVN